MGKINYFRLIFFLTGMGIFGYSFFLILTQPSFSLEKDGIEVRGQIIKITHKTLQERTVSIIYSYKVGNQEYTGMRIFNGFILENLPQIGDSCRVTYYVKDPSFSHIRPLRSWTKR